MKEGQKFILLDANYSIDTERATWGPVIKLWGKTLEGASVCAKIRDFMPYFYVPYDPQFRRHQLENALREALDSPTTRPPTDRYVLDMEIVPRMTIMNYQPTGASQYYKITMSSPTQVNTARKFFEAYGIPTFEANIAYVLRLMIDKNFGGCHWIGFKRHRSTVRETTCTYEFEASHVDIEIDREDQNLDPIRIMSFDIEACKFSGRGFVDAAHDPITQIGCSVETIDRKVIKRVVFCLVRPGETVGLLPDPTIEVLTFTSERHMISSWAKFVRDNEIDIITGYNIDNFDFPYMFGRVKALQMSAKEFGSILSREPEKPATIKKSFFESKAKGAREDFSFQCQGRFALDTLKFVKEFFKFRYYGLSAVSEFFTGDTKVDMPYDRIPIYQRGTPEQRAHLCYYCWKDAQLCLDILFIRKASIMYVQNARACGVPWKFLIEKGLQVRCQSLIGRYSGRRDVILPSKTAEENDDKTKGAIVKDPKIGFYDEWVITLDFQSLYPSCMRAWNICYSTFVSRKWAEANLKPGDYYLLPDTVPNAEYCFVAEHIRLGILPEIETALFNLRNQAKKKKAESKGTPLFVVYDKLQEAYKLQMNSLYGFLKADTLCKKELMEAVTGFGRWMLEETTKIVENNFPGSEVIYGDTDSVFITFGKQYDMEEAFALGQQAADMCTDYFTKIRTDAGKEPVHLLQREKGFKPFMLCRKKRYAGLKFLSPTEKPEQSESGVETVRRDNAKIGSGTMAECLKMMITEGDVKGERSIAFVHNTIRDLLQGRIPLDQLVITKGLSKSKKAYEESTSRQIHVELANRIEARSHETGEQPYATGDRVPFVMVPGTKDSPAFERGEDPLYAIRHGIPIDYNYYIRNQMMKPLLRIFTPLLAPDEKLKKYNKKGKKVDLNQKELEALTAYKVLFTGDHMIHITQKTPTATTGILKFITRNARCMVCSTPITGQGLICSNCEDHSAEKRRELLDIKQELETKQAERLEKCRACVKNDTLQDFPPCSNLGCANMLGREKGIVDIEEICNKLNAF